MTIDGGAVWWARQTIESDIFSSKPDVWFKIWFYLVVSAKWRDDKGLKRGQCFMKYAWITENTGANRNEIDHCIRWLKRAKQIATLKATRGFVLTICNYEKFQDTNNYKSDTKSDTKSDIKATQKRQDTKEGEEGKKKRIQHTSSDTSKNGTCPYQEIVDLYHEILPELPEVLKITKPRKAQMKARWENDLKMDLEEYRRYFKFVREWPFLMGTKPGSTWRASLEWLTKEANFTKVIEEYYDR